MKALGADRGISKSEVSRISSDLDCDAQAFRQRGLSEGTLQTLMDQAELEQEVTWQLDIA